MGYTSRNSRKPFEAASKASHHHIINDPEVQAVIERIHKPPENKELSLADLIEDFVITQENNPVEAVIAVDGGYTEVILDREFPSRTIHFLQFGALLFKAEDLAEVDAAPFIAPEDMTKLKNIDRLKLALPTKNLWFQDEETVQGSILKAIYEFFCKSKLEDNSLIDTLRWFILRCYKQGNRKEKDKYWNLATNPLSSQGNQVVLSEKDMNRDYTFVCPETKGKIYLTDIFRFQEIIDEETGAAGILGYLVNTIEHIIIIHLIRQLLRFQPEKLKNVLFIKDGSTGFFGQTAPLHDPMNDLVNWLLDKHNILLVGLEKSGAFVDHAQEIQNKLKPGQALVLTDKYIYTYILPGGGDSNRPYASTSNYGHKIIFKTRKGQMHVVSVPVRELKKNPKAVDLPNLQVLLNNVENLHCDMYDSALFLLHS